jgi:hypothetical protein
MKTKPKGIEDNPFAGLFEKHPWLVPMFMMMNRQSGAFKSAVIQQIGIFREFYEVYIRVFAERESRD